MTGKVLHVNISRGGLPKRPIPAGYATREGLEGDMFSKPHIHGGPEQALLVIGQEAIDELVALGFPLFAGALGENLTTQGLDRREMRTGQRFRAGDAVIEIARLRAPCRSLAVYGPGMQEAIFDEACKSGDASSPKWGLSGFYASVVRAGRIVPGSTIRLLGQIV